MKALYHTISGHVYVEDIDPNFRTIQFPDGDHPISKAAVWWDVDHKLDAIYLIHQGVQNPVGDTSVRAPIIETDQLRRFKRSIHRSKMFWRRLYKGLWDGLNILAVVVMAWSMYLLLLVFIWAWYGVLLPPF